jgi:hypothetical protein
MYTLCNCRPTQIVTSNHKGLRRKDLITIRVGKMVINPRTIIIMRIWVIMLERENEKDVR